jgi:hypothetical protein
MSVSSLENGNLTLGNLTINNSQYAEASGYVPSQTVILSNKTGTSLSTGALTTTGGITALSTINAPAFTGGLGKLYLTNVSTGQLASGASYTVSNVEIPNFVGNSSSCFVVSCSNVQFYPWFFSVSYASQSGTSTFVNVAIGNAGSITTQGAFNLCIIAMK